VSLQNPSRTGSPSKALPFSNSGNVLPVVGMVIRKWSLLLVLTLTWGCGEDPKSPGSVPAPNRTPALEKESTPYQVPLPSTGRSSEALQPADQDLNPPRFQGLKQLIAGDGALVLKWDDAIDDVSHAGELIYHVYASERAGKQDFLSPPLLITEAGAQSCRLSALKNGITLHVVVRAVDATGKSDSNEVEWAGTPNPVLFVDVSANESGNGESPRSAMKSIDEAIGAAIGMAGVNIYVAEGTYPEQFLLFDGMSLYGGFPPGFEAFPNPTQHPTRLEGKQGKDTLILPPGNHLAVIDGLILTGGGTARRAIVADDCVLQISHCRISGFADKGIQIETDTDDGGEAKGSLLFSDIQNNRGDGLRIEGFVDLAIRECRFTNNQQSGISSPSLQPRHGEKTRLDLHRVLVADNGDIGINIRISEPDLGDPSDPPRVRLGLFGVQSKRNADHGMGFDLRYTADQNVDMRIRLEHCLLSENRKSGIYLDADAIGDYSVSHCVFERNTGDSALKISGDATGALIHVRECRVSPQQGYSLYYRGAGLVNILGGNLASTGPDGNSILNESRGTVSVTQLLAADSGSAANPSLMHWEKILESPGKISLSHDLNALPAPPAPRPITVIGIHPGPGNLLFQDPLIWKVLRTDEAVEPVISATIDGQTQTVVSRSTGETTEISIPNPTLNTGKLLLNIIIPEHSGFPSQSHSFEYNSAGDR
jgi:hypothetical protein